jgi:TolC family type I secretion outer membrane protein
MPEALGAAYLYNPALRSARRGLDIVNEKRPQALAGWTPQISITGIGSQSRTHIPTEAYRTSNAGATTLFSLPITKGGGEYANLRQADHLIRAQRALLLATEQVVLGQAAQAYLDVVLAQAVVKYRTDNLAALKRALALILRQMALGDRTAVDAGLAEARTANAEALLAQARGLAEVALANYVLAIGRPAGRLVPPAPLAMLPPTLEETVRLAEAFNPDVVAAQYQWMAARSDVEVQTAQLLPGLRLDVTDQRSTQQIRGFQVQPSGAVSGTSVELVLSVPLYQGGTEYAAVRIAKKTALQRADDLAVARVKAVAAATTAWKQREAAEATRAGFTATLAAYEKLASLNQRLSEAGQLTILEVLNALQDLVDAQINKANAEHDRILADYSVLNSLGGLTARTLALAVPYYDPEGDYRRTKWRIFGLSIGE